MTQIYNNAHIRRSQNNVLGISIIVRAIFAKK